MGWGSFPLDFSADQCLGEVVLSLAALKANFDAYIGEVLRRTTPAERKSFTHFIADSYETSPQNWTDGFE